MNRNNFITGIKKKMQKAKRAKKPKTVEQIISEEYDGEELLFAEGFGEAIIGVMDMTVGHNACIVYDYQKCIEILIARDKMSYDEAVEFMEYNVTGAFVGDATPAFIHTITT